VAEKLSALDTEKILSERSGKADISKFLATLKKVKSRKPVSGDEL
jgi:hypothetical protein